MADIIPRPARAKQTDEKIWFSENTVFNGEFAEVAKRFQTEAQHRPLRKEIRF